MSCFSGQISAALCDFFFFPPSQEEESEERVPRAFCVVWNGEGGEAKMSIFVAEWGSSITQKCAPTTSQPLKKVEMCRRCLDRCSSEGVRFLSLCSEEGGCENEIAMQKTLETRNRQILCAGASTKASGHPLRNWLLEKCAEQGRIFPPSEAGRRRRRQKKLLYTEGERRKEASKK